MKTKSVVVLLVSVAGAALLSATAACGDPLTCQGQGQTQTVDYTAAQDLAAISQIQSAWSGTLADGRKLTLSICEDVGNTADPTVTTECGVVAHLIASNDQNASYTETGNCDIGGCFPQVAMNAKALLTIDGVATSLNGSASAPFQHAYDQGWSVDLADVGSGKSVELHIGSGAPTATLDLPSEADAGTAATQLNAQTQQWQVLLTQSGAPACPIAQ